MYIKISTLAPAKGIFLHTKTIIIKQEVLIMLYINHVFISFEKFRRNHVQVFRRT